MEVAKSGHVGVNVMKYQCPIPWRQIAAPTKGCNEHQLRMQHPHRSAEVGPNRTGAHFETGLSLSFLC